ncbi:MAG: class I SAM-dependent methyltransferase [Bacteroidia bacterium]|nr:class I SAM-dependent methyltransferase [Bacteroidia bacterium]
MPDKKFDRVLELGCGIGYQSAFLSKIANNVMATDLPDPDIQAHAPGMEVAKNLHNKLNVKNVQFIACSAETLPFEDSSFDLIYSSHVLEHIPDRDKALAEMARVLKPGGIYFCVTPVSFEKLYSFLNYYLLLVTRIFALLGRIVKRIFWSKDRTSQPGVSVDGHTAKAKSTFWASFPFPPPHGTGRHFLSELVNWTPGKWKKEQTKHDEFEFVSQQTTQWLPFLPVLGFIHPVLGTRMHARTRSFELRTGKFRFFQCFGINTVIILKRK